MRTIEVTGFVTFTVHFLYTHTGVNMYIGDMMLTVVHRVSVHF